MNYTRFVVLYFLAFGATIWVTSGALPLYITHGYEFIACSLLTVIFAYSTLPFVRRKCFNQRVHPLNKAVIITGCDTGFGHKLAKRLDSKGFYVFASCMFPDGDGAKSLKDTCSSRLRVLGLYVTKDESVKDALAYVKANKGEAELWAVINNAGIFRGHEIAWTNLRYFNQCYEVNTLGVIRMTKAFLPLLFRSKGRVVTVASIVGRIALPGNCAYTMTKCATISFSETLRQEMKPWGVKVITIEPEGFKTPISSYEAMSKTMEETINEADEDIKADYGDKYFHDFKDRMKGHLETCSSSIHKVIDSMEDAVSLEHPCDVYKPTRNIFVSTAIRLLENCPRPLIDTVVNISSKNVTKPKLLEEMQR